MREVQVNGQNICLANINGKYFAMNNTCSHERGRLADGKLERYEVECPWHGSKFDVMSGEPTKLSERTSFQIAIRNFHRLISCLKVIKNLSKIQIISRLMYL